MQTSPVVIAASYLTVFGRCRGRRSFPFGRDKINYYKKMNAYEFVYFLVVVTVVALVVVVRRGRRSNSVFLFDFSRMPL